MQHADAYMVVYDSIQKLSDRQKLDELMDNHELEEHKRMVSQQERAVIGYLVGTVFFLVLAGIFFSCGMIEEERNVILLCKESLCRSVWTLWS